MSTDTRAATREEITGVLGIHTMSLVAPILIEELEAAARRRDAAACAAAKA